MNLDMFGKVFDYELCTKILNEIWIFHLDAFNWNLHQFLGLNFVKTNNWIVDYGMQHIFKLTLHINVFGPFGIFMKSNILSLHIKGFLLIHKFNQ